MCIYMAAAQAVAIDTSGPADFFFLRCPHSLADAFLLTILPAAFLIPP